MLNTILRVILFIFPWRFRPSTWFAMERNIVKTASPMGQIILVLAIAAVIFAGVPIGVNKVQSISKKLPTSKIVTLLPNHRFIAEDLGPATLVEKYELGRRVTVKVENTKLNIKAQLARHTVPADQPLRVCYLYSEVAEEIFFYLVVPATDSCTKWQEEYSTK